MLNKYPIFKWFSFILLGTIALLVLFGFWFMSLIPSEHKRSEWPSTLPEDLPYLSSRTEPIRGKVLAVVTSHAVMGSTGKKTGYELTELARPYYVFQANGFEIDVASPKGGQPPVVIDREDMGEFDYAFLNDSVAQRKVQKSIPLHEVNPEEYVAVYFVGGKGAMFDFPDHPAIKSIIQNMVTLDKVIGAVCHGPAALVNVTLTEGNEYYLADKSVSGFTNNEELFLIPEAGTIFPFLLQDKMVERGANFDEVDLYLKNVVQDGNLITGQNPWSTWAFAEAMVQQLGYSPKDRKWTAEENSIEVLSVYKTQGLERAIEKINMIHKESGTIDRRLIAMHGVIAAMQFHPMEVIDKIRLMVYDKEQSNS